MTVDFLAEELHKFYRAALKATHSGECGHEHDHGWKNCHRKDYFAKRAQEILNRNKAAWTLRRADDIEEARVLAQTQMAANQKVNADLDALTRPMTTGWKLTANIPAGATFGDDLLGGAPEDVAAYDQTIQRWKSGNGVSRFIYYSAQRLTLEVVGLAAMRAQRAS